MDATDTFTHVKQWLAWLEAQSPPEKIELGLQRVTQVAKYLLGESAIAHTVITVAGTNGKGSSIAYLGSILAKANISYATLTSPHFARFNERISYNGQHVSDDDLLASFVRVNQARLDAAQTPIWLTYFEFNALLAFDLMRHWQPQVALLEIGLGGRLDAVNCIDADIALVTNIALDHEDWLGSDLAQIGHEKAGIYRPQKIAIFGQQDGPQSVPEYAKKIGAYWHHNGQQFQQQGQHWQGINDQGKPCQLTIPDVQLPPQNVAAVVQAIKLLPQNIAKHITDQAIVEGLQSARLTGRMQVFDYHERTIILDVAHNPAAAKNLWLQVAQSLAVTHTEAHSNGAQRHNIHSTVHGVMGILSDKDYPQVLQLLNEVIDIWHFATLTGPRGLNSQQLMAAMPNNHLATKQSSAQVPTNQSTQRSHYAYASVTEAIKGAIHLSQKGDRILVCGSFHTVGDALQYFSDEIAAN